MLKSNGQEGAGRPALPTTMAGSPSAESGAAVARYLTEFLTGERPGTAWGVTPEISRDGKRVYFTNGLYSSWDEQFYPEGLPGWMVKLDVKPSGGISVDPGFLATFGDARAHQVRLEGGDASTDTFCFPS